MKVLVTGATGFIGKNLCMHLENANIQVLKHKFSKQDGVKKENSLEAKIYEADLIIHLAYINRAEKSDDFEYNINMTQLLLDALEIQEKKIPIIFTSTIHTHLQTDYTKSKLEVEKLLIDYTSKAQLSLIIYRLNNVFGKWCAPNSHSVVATFCHNILNDLPITINNSNAALNLIYIDDLIDDILNTIQTFENKTLNESLRFIEVSPVYSTTVGELALHIEEFKAMRTNLLISDVGADFKRALYATYLSYMQPSQFSYKLPMHVNEKGIFMEVLKTPLTGQISFFTVTPGQSRGNHYHHTKNEKFIVLQGEAKFSFKNLITDTYTYLEVSSKNIEVVDIVPGFAHKIENIGKCDLIVIVWANEIYDPKRPDAVLCD